jgi:serine protease Do
MSIGSVWPVSGLSRILRCLAVGLVGALVGGVVMLAPSVGRAADVMIGTDQSDLIRSLLPTVVNITTSKVEPLNPPAPQMASAATPPPKTAVPTTIKSYVGSGFIVDPSGVIVTNYHVVEDAFEIVVTLSDGTRLKGKMLAASRLADLALVKIDTDHPLKAAQWGDSDTVQVGDQVFAAGNPFGIGLSISSGIVSALNRDIQNSPYDDLIQTDAAINHGNSGGPLFNMKGQVIGVDSDILSPTTGSVGLGFAIPSSSAQFVAQRLQMYGWVRPSWIGLKLQQVTPDIAQALGMEQSRGSLVSWVMEGSPAAKAGMKIGDAVMAFNGAPPSDERALLRDIAHTSVGDSIILGVRRDGKMVDVRVQVAEWPRNQWDKFDAPAEATQPKIMIPADLGLTMAPLTPDDRIKMNTGAITQGVVIKAVAANSDAYEKGVVAGDIIMRVQDKPVATKAEVLAAVQADRVAKRRYTLLLILPKARTLPGPKYYALEVGPSGG